MDKQQYYNILIDTLPVTVEVDGRVYPIASDFRTGILFEMLASDRSLDEDTIALSTLELFFPSEVPDNLEGAYSEILWFYRCGYEVKPTRKRGDQQAEQGNDSKRIFDYDEDAPLIYAAFLSQYGVDLQDVEYLHWWKFNAMFQGLHDERITEIIGYRSMDLGSIKDKDTRAHYARLQQKYALPDGLTVEEKIARAGNIFAGGI